jgi:fucose permease
VQCPYYRIVGDYFQLLIAAGFTGGTILPAAVGYISKGSSVKAGIWVIPLSAFLLLVVQGMFVRNEENHPLHRPVLAN